MVILEKLLIVFLAVVARDSLSKFLTEVRMVLLKKCCVLSEIIDFSPDPTHDGVVVLVVYVRIV
jgi:hypothetical protein